MAPSASVPNIRQRASGQSNGSVPGIHWNWVMSEFLFLLCLCLNSFYTEISCLTKRIRISNALCSKIFFKDDYSNFV